MVVRVRTQKSQECVVCVVIPLSICTNYYISHFRFNFKKIFLRIRICVCTSVKHSSKMHLFWKRLMEHPHLANVYSYNIKGYTPVFTQVFRQLFPGNGVYGRNTTSYLNAIADRFTFNMNAVPVYPHAYYLVHQLFYALGLDPNRLDNQGVYNFWLYLTAMYAQIVETSENYTFYRDDQIFGFMSAFNLHSARVVILASDPSKQYESSGYAFHASPTPASRQLLDNLNKEMWLMDKLTGRQEMGMCEHVLHDYKSHCDFNGWIGQNVLMLNSWLSYDENKWEEFTNFIVAYLSRQMDDLVFILMGQVAFNKVPLIDYGKHLILRVHHPGHYHRRTHVNPQGSHLEWDRVLPFINTNFYLFQVASAKGREHDPNNMIDWNSISGGSIVGGWEDRWEAYADLFNTAWGNMDSAVEEGIPTAAYWDQTTGERALIVKQSLNGRCLLQRDYNYEI